jgi:hypothetical protein
MDPSSTVTVATDGEHLTCGGVSLGDTVLLNNFKFIANYFSGLSLSPRRANDGAALMGSTRSGASTPQRATIEDSTEEFLTTSGGEGSFDPLLTEGTTQGLCSLPPQRRLRWRTLGSTGHDNDSLTDGGAASRNQPHQQCHAHCRGHRAQAHAQQAAAGHDAASP